jgi:hypothetical protein
MQHVYAEFSGPNQKVVALGILAIAACVACASLCALFLKLM